MHNKLDHWTKQEA